MWLGVRVRGYPEDGQGSGEEGRGAVPNWDRKRDPPQRPSFHQHAAVTFHPVFPPGVLEIPVHSTLT